MFLKNPKNEKPGLRIENLGRGAHLIGPTHLQFWIVLAFVAGFLSPYSGTYTGEKMGLKDFLKSHQDKEDKDVIVEDNDGETTIHLGKAFKAIKNAVKKK